MCFSPAQHLDSQVKGVLKEILLPVSLSYNPVVATSCLDCAVACALLLAESEELVPSEKPLADLKAPLPEKPALAAVADVEKPTGGPEPRGGALPLELSLEHPPQEPPGRCMPGEEELSSLSPKLVFHFTLAASVACRLLCCHL